MLAFLAAEGQTDTKWPNGEGMGFRIDAANAETPPQKKRKCSAPEAEHG
jgi:hypothetical protein